MLLVLPVRLQWNLMLPVLLSRLPCHSIIERLTLVGCRFCRLLVVLVMCLVLLRIVSWRHTFILCADVVDVVVLRVLDVRIVLVLFRCIPALTDELCGRCSPNLTLIR